MRVIGPDGKQIGVMGQSEALGKARDMGLDLVEIAPKANPPVAKIIDFTKFKYEQEKKTREERRKERKGTTIKEIWFTPLIGRGDYQVRLTRVREFLGEHEKVRVIVRPKRRLPKTDPLYRVIERVIKDTEDLARVEQEPKMLGRQLMALIAPGGIRSESSKQGRNENEDKENSGKAVQGNSGRENTSPEELPPPLTGK